MYVSFPPLQWPSLRSQCLETKNSTITLFFTTSWQAFFQWRHALWYSRLRSVKCVPSLFVQHHSEATYSIKTTAFAGIAWERSNFYFKRFLKYICMSVFAYFYLNFVTAATIHFEFIDHPLNLRWSTLSCVWSVENVFYAHCIVFLYHLVNTSYCFIVNYSNVQKFTEENKK